jgi:hypothetical protein
VRWLALMAILVLPAFLNLWDLTGEGYSNYYYGAAVKNVLTGWHNFVSFDAGFVSVDKPPLGLWIQAASAYVFGFRGWIILLPQAIAGVLSVALLYHLVRRTFGTAAGVLSGLVLALTPIVVTSRNNTMDRLLGAEEWGLRTSKVLVDQGKDLDSRVDAASTALENVKGVGEILVGVGEGDTLSRAAVGSKSTGAGGPPSAGRPEGI